MSEKPSYLGLLNAIALGERRGHAVLNAWSQVTGDAELAQVLELVAIREQEHAAAFTKRLSEMGYSVREPETPSGEFERSLESARSSAPDLEKFRTVLGYQGDPARTDPGQTDPLARIFEDPTIDPLTGALLGRFIAEERDSERQLRAQCQRVSAASNGEIEDDGQVLADIAARIDRLAQTIEELKQLRR